ncbi:MAG: ABC transporter ATP-binding protein [Desulfobacterales bacterium]|nr:MAG: ABC transporter ATP-binding protein [Desulfobacterales bacterium]
MLEVQNLEKSFGGLKAVADCSLEVKEGLITGLIGPNGAGKTTLFNVITGHYKPDKGKIFFQGEEIDGLRPDQIFQKKIYRTFQITREFSQMTVLENLMIMPEGQIGERIWNTWFRPPQVKKQEKAIREKALDVLEFVELIDLKNEYAGSLSGGQKKLLELARSMMADPKIVLLDEPGAGVNPTLMKKLIANIETLCEEKGITFFLIEHDMDLVMKLCNPVIVMSEGKKLAEGTADEIKHNEEVLEAYLGGQYR